MAKPNYQFEKRRKEMDKAAKKEAKRLRKLEAGNNPATPDAEAPDAETPAPPTEPA